MGIAPVIGVALGAVSTVSQLSAQNRAADAQRQQIQSARLANQQAYELSRQRFEFAKETANAAYVREKLVLDELRRDAGQQLQLQTAQQGIANAQREMEQAASIAGLDQQVNQLIGQAANVRTQSGVANSQELMALAARFMGGERQGLQFIQSLAANNMDPALAEQFLNESLLQQIADFQATRESVLTRDRVAGFQAEALETTADLTSQYRNSVDAFFQANNATNKQFQDFVTAQMPSILDLEHQRNIAALDAQRHARIAEMNIAQEANAINLQNSERVANAQMAGVQGGNSLGAAINIGSSLLNTFGSFGSFGSPAAAAQPASGALNFGSGVISDFTGANIFA